MKEKDDIFNKYTKIKEKEYIINNIKNINQIKNIMKKLKI